MKVFNIISEQASTINNAREMASAFNSDQWNSIYAHFGSEANINFGSRRSEIASRFLDADKEIGKDMPEYTNEYDWLRRARRWGINLRNPNATWDEIYRTLEPFAGEPIINNFSGWSDTSQSPASSSPNTMPNTPESVEDIKSQVSNLDETFDTWQDMTSRFAEFTNTWMQSHRSDEWQRKFRCTATSGGPSSTTELLNQRIRELKSQIESGNTVTMEDVVEAFHKWLLVADVVFANENYCPE